MALLTDKQKQDYLTESSACPFCRSTDIEGRSIEVDGPHAWQPMSCNACHEDWNDLYTLTGIEARSEYPLFADSAPEISVALGHD